MSKMEKEQYLGVSVSPLTYEEIIADIKKRIAAGKNRPSLLSIRKK